MKVLRTAAAFALLLSIGCKEKPAPPAAEAPAARPSILLVTLDTTRADSIGPEAKGVQTPAFNAVAARGLRFRHAYATVPETLPSHASMMTGLYAGGHGIHENARYVSDARPLLAQKLKEAGYATAAFVSGYPLDRRFGIGRGFDRYDDEMDQGRSERSARSTTDRARSFLQAAGPQPLFVWVHYFDPHAPYEPPEPFRSQYRDRPYLGEVAAMDRELGRLLEAFQRRAGNSGAVLIVGDHGEGLGDHGELQHGYLLYDATMRVPLVIAGPGVHGGVSDEPVSNRRIFHTILDWAGLGSGDSLRAATGEVVAGEAMKPFLSFGWQPQVMAVENSIKVIQAGTLEVYDLAKDPAEAHDLGASAALSRETRRTLRDYPVPSLAATPSGANLSEEERRRLASLGYLTSDTRPVVRKDAPKPRDMARLFEPLELASGLFVAEQYREAVPVLEAILAADPQNLMAALRLAAAHSALGNNAEALRQFQRAREMAPQSSDVRHYLALHYLRTGEWQKAAPLLESVLAETPDRLPAIEAMAVVRERQGRPEEALQLWKKVQAARKLAPDDLTRIGELAMSLGNTPAAIQAFEEAKRAEGTKFARDLELGVLYLDAGRLQDARASLDRVPRSSPGYAMALFKRAQVSVLLREPDAPARIETARSNADGTTRELIARERLFQNAARP